MSTLVCVNPAAGGGGAVRRLQRALRSGEAAALRCTVVEVTSLADMCSALGNLRPGDTPVAAGGDGTLTLLATALRRNGLTGVPIGLLPLGTGNILAHELGITDIEAGLRALGGPLTAAVDALATSHPAAPLAFVSISGGFEADFIARYARFRRVGRPIGILAGLAATVPKRRSIRLWLDDERVLESDAPVFSAGLYNTAHYAARLAMSPEARIDDGLGDAAVYRSARTYWSTAFGAVSGRPLKSPLGPERRRWRTARLEASGPLQIDGESLDACSISVSIEPGHLRVRVPASS